MSAFASSTEKILQTGLSSSSSSLGIQVSHDPPGNENRRLKIAAAVVFVLITLIACAALVGIYLSQPPPPPEVFTIILKDPEAQRPARMKVKFVKMDHIELNRSPVINSDDVIYMLKDFSRGLVAYKDFRQGLCMVGRLNDTEDSGKQRAKAFKNKIIQVAATEEFLVLNGSIHREVLEYAAGSRIMRYCGKLVAYWVVRRLPSEPSPFDPHLNSLPHSEIVTAKAVPSEDIPGEEEKMQILSESNGNDELQTEHELPPEDPQLIQEAEKTAVLEEKSSILAEKLDLPEESIRPNKGEELASLLEEKSPNAEDTAPTDVLPSNPFLEAKLPGLFGVPPKETSDDEPSAANGDRTTNAEEAAAAAEFGLSDERNDDVVVIPSEKLHSTDEKNEEKMEVKSTPDEKSTVEKGLPLEDKPPSHVINDEFMLEKVERERDNETINDFQSEVRQEADLDLTSNDGVAIAERLSIGDENTPSPLEVDLKELPRRKRHTCVTRCWYFIQKLKGYRCCMLRCF